MKGEDLKKKRSREETLEHIPKLRGMPMREGETHKARGDLRCRGRTCETEGSQNLHGCYLRGNRWVGAGKGVSSDAAVIADSGQWRSEFMYTYFACEVRGVRVKEG